jgi:hemerythrin-like domain-containing protein
MTAKNAADNSNAIDLLTEDHKMVKRMFKEFDKNKESAEATDKEELVGEICDALELHAEIEEQIFYPAARAAIGDDDMMNEAEVEHAAAKDLIEQLRGMDPSDELYDAKVTVLSEQIDHHVEEEEKEMFPKVKKAKLDLEALGEQMQEMKDSRMAPAAPGKRAGRPAARP